MALSNDTIFEVRTAGNDNNGGGFVNGATGTDYSQQAAAQTAYADLVIGNPVNTDLTSAATPFAATDVGNLIQITGGVGFTVGVYEITAVVGVVATCDRVVGIAGSVNGTGNLGGAFQTIAQAESLMTDDAQMMYVMADGVYNIGVQIVFGINTGGLYQRRVIGYSSTRGDRGRPTILATAGITLFRVTGSGWWFENLIFDGNGGTGTDAIWFDANDAGGMFNCRVDDFATRGVYFRNAVRCGMFNCEISGTTAGRGILVGGSADSTRIINCYVHDNSTQGVYFTGRNIFIKGCIFESNGNNGIQGTNTSSTTVIIDSSIYGNTLAGISFMSAYYPRGMSIIMNNTISQNGGWGLEVQPAGHNTDDWDLFDYNAYYLNTAGALTGYDGGDNDVTLTADPFVDAANGDFALNDVAGGGALCKEAGFPGAFVGGLSTGYQDIGALQSEAPEAISRAIYHSRGIYKARGRYT